ncbi:MAG: PIN domain-containing protein [Myxococcales bacterium]|nr:PIN domain-containing protein [Myxococcales bacterium]
MKGVVYVETSAVLRILIEGDRLLAARIGKAKKLITSALTGVEATRGLLRAAREGRIDRRLLREGQAWLRRFLRSCDIVVIDHEVLDRAADEFPIEPIRTLDALHVASALRWESGVGATLVVSCEDRVRDNARALGMTVYP